MKKTTLIDLTGRKFGRWLVISRAGKGKQGQPKWACICDCGNSKIIYGASLRKGDSKSCGCLHRELARLRTYKSFKDTWKTASITHGMSKTNIFKIWAGMKKRCTNPKTSDFSLYGGRGITVCYEWRNSFEQFYKDMGPRPSKYHSIDRIDNEKGYSKENCRWATKQEQARNKRNNYNITYNGETKTVSEWARIYGISRKLIKYRISKGWPIEKAIKQLPKTSDF